MPDDSDVSRKQLARALASDPVLLDFLKPFPKLLPKDAKNPAEAFDRMAKKLAGTRRAGVIQFRLTRGRRTKCWGLALSPKESRVIDAEVESPALELITDEKTWAAIAGGQLAPLEAFAGGKLRVRGDLELARSMVRRIRKR